MTVVIGGLALTFSVANYFWINLFAGIIPITDIWRYPQILRSLHGSQYPKNSDVLEFFPKAVPVDASNLQMHYWTPSGGMSFQLKCTLPASDVAALVARVSPFAMVTARGGDEFLSVLSSHNEFLPVQLFVGGTRMAEQLPATSTIYVTNVGYTSIGPGMECMYESGIIVDSTTSNVIYWLESNDSGVSIKHGTTLP